MGAAGSADAAGGLTIARGEVWIARRCPWRPCALDTDRNGRVICLGCERGRRQVDTVVIRDGRCVNQGHINSTIDLQLRVAGLEAAAVDGDYLVFGRAGRPTLYAVALASAADWIALASGLVDYARVRTR